MRSCPSHGGLFGVALERMYSRKMPALEDAALQGIFLSLTNDIPWVTTRPKKKHGVVQGFLRHIFAQDLTFSIL